jgi:hypothetical protein
MKKENQLKKPDQIVDLSLGAAAGLLALVFVEGIFWGYMIRTWRN